MDVQLGAGQRGIKSTDGGSSTQRDARPTVTGKLALIRRLFGSGGTVCRNQETPKQKYLDLYGNIWYNKQGGIWCII